MYKRFQAFLLCVVFSCTIAACNGEASNDVLGKKQDSEDMQDVQESKQNPKDEQSQDASESSKDTEGEESGEPEPLLDADATDEELLDVLKDDIHVVADDDYVAMVKAFTEETDEYAGDIYQLEGLYTTEDGFPYVTRTVVDGDSRTASSMPLKYVDEEPEEGAWIRVTGIVNRGEVNGEDRAVLETVVLEIMEEQGQAELSAHGQEIS